MCVFQPFTYARHKGNCGNLEIILSLVVLYRKKGRSLENIFQIVVLLYMASFSCANKIKSKSKITELL